MLVCRSLYLLENGLRTTALFWTITSRRSPLLILSFISALVCGFSCLLANNSRMTTLFCTIPSRRSPLFISLFVSALDLHEDTHQWCVINGSKMTTLFCIITSRRIPLFILSFVSMSVCSLRTTAPFWIITSRRSPLFISSFFSMSVCTRNEYSGQVCPHTYLGQLVTLTNDCCLEYKCCQTLLIVQKGNPRANVLLPGKRHAFTWNCMNLDMYSPGQHW